MELLQVQFVGRITVNWGLGGGCENGWWWESPVGTGLKPAISHLAMSEPVCSHFDWESLCLDQGCV